MSPDPNSSLTEFLDQLYPHDIRVSDIAQSLPFDVGGIC